MTNDGNFANLLAHPSSHISKTYRVTVRSAVTGEQLSALSDGVVIDGKRTLPADVRMLDENSTGVVLEIVIYEGRNRQIRKMCEAVGLTVARLKRTKIGSVKLGMLKVGAWRRLTEAEVRALTNAAEKRRKHHAVL